jgi:hypothetical protein
LQENATQNTLDNISTFKQNCFMGKCI